MANDQSFLNPDIQSLPRHSNNKKTRQLTPEDSFGKIQSTSFFQTFEKLGLQMSALVGEKRKIKMTLRKRFVFDVV